MPKPSSGRYSRARIRSRARYRRPRQARSSRWFYSTLVVVVSALVTGIVLTRAGNEASADVPPRAPNQLAGVPGDHWHAVIGVNICGEWLPDPPEFETAAGNFDVRVGIHTHGDGFIHIHPFFRSEAGDNATLGRFLRNGGWSASRDGLTVWDGPSASPVKTEWQVGDRCPGGGGRGHVVFEVNCSVARINPSSYKPRDQDVIALGFLPRGEELGVPPHADAAPANDGGGAGPVNQPDCRPSAAGNPGVSDATTTTPAATTP